MKETIHGHNTRKGGKSPTYRSWQAMINRCTNAQTPNYAKYGAAGITVCERWKIFADFLADMGERPTLKHSLDRYPNKSGNYEPGNVRWATRRQQNRNTSSCRKVIRSDGLEFPSIVEAAESTGGNKCCIRDTCAGRQHSHLGFGWRYAE